MTTITETTHRRGHESVARILNVTRLHLTNRFSIIVLPLLILAFIFLVNYIIWWLLFDAVGVGDQQDAVDGIQFSGASSFIFVYMLVVAVQAVNLTFPFALGYSVTRRDFYLGTGVAFALLSVFYAAIMTVMAVLERLTGGWGLGGSMFNVIYFREENPILQFVLFLLAFLFFFFIGAATASVYVRWRANGMYVFFACLTLIVVGLVALTTFVGGWPTVGSWFVSNGALGVAAWSLVPTIIAAITGFSLIRRATPNN